MTAQTTGGLTVKNSTTKKLIPWATNARTHSDEQVDQIVASIKEFGFTNPILIDEKDRIIAGHGRVLAAQKLEMLTVPAIVLKGLSDVQKRAYCLADNKLALNAGWDNELLSAEILALEEADFDIDLTGFEPDELEWIMGRTPMDPDGTGVEPAPPKTAVCKKGDKWILGDHILTVGASDLKAADQTIMSWQGYTDDEALLGKLSGPTFKETRKARK